MPKSDPKKAPAEAPPINPVREAKAYAKFLKSQESFAHYRPYEPPKPKTKAPAAQRKSPPAAVPQTPAANRVGETSAPVAYASAPPRSDAAPTAKSAEPRRRETSAPAPTITLPDAAAHAPDSREGQLAAMHHEAHHCRACALGSSRKNVVFGVGNPNADLVFIGEAPGAQEDETGLPFVGRSGNLLTTELAKLGIPREDVYICNILKCRPPNNRDPLPSEVETCQHFLHRQLALLKPKMLCSLGRIALSTLLARPVAIMKIRGTWETYRDYPLFISLHPSAVLHQPQNRELFVQDLTTLAAAYHARDEKTPGKTR